MLLVLTELLPLSQVKGFATNCIVVGNRLVHFGPHWWSLKHQLAARRSFLSVNLQLLSCCHSCECFQQVVFVCSLTSLPTWVKLCEVINSCWITLSCQLTESAVTHQPRLHTRGPVGLPCSLRGKLLHSLIPLNLPYKDSCWTVWNTP